MPSRDDLKVVATPPELFSKAWAHCGPMLLRGLAAADMDLKETMDRVVDRTVQLWLILDGYKLKACFLTEIFEDDGKKIISIGALAGEGVGAWHAAMFARIEQYAKDEGASAVRFGGKAAWARLQPSYRQIGKRGEAAIFQRALT